MKRKITAISGLAVLTLISCLAVMQLAPINDARADAASIPVQDVAPKVEPKADGSQQVRTSCFEFVVAKGTQITGSGCRAAAVLNSTQYFTIEVLGSDQPGASLESTAQQLLKGIQQSLDGNPATRAGLEKPGPYDSVQMGKYAGQKADRFQGMPSIEMRWDNRGNIVPTVKVLAIVALPHTRYVWDGTPQQYLMVSWYELDSDYARYSRAAKASIKLL